MALENAATTTAYADLELRGGDVGKVMNDIVNRINTIGTTLNKIIADSAKGANAIDSKFQKSADELLKKLATAERLQKALTNQQNLGVTTANRERAFAGQVRGASIFTMGLKEAQTAAEGLQARLNQIQQKMARTGTASKMDIRREMNTEQALKDLNQLEKKLNSLDNKARQSGGRFSTEQKAVADARAALQAKVLNPRASNFAEEGRALTDAAARYERAVGSFTRLQGQSGAITLKSRREEAVLQAQMAARDGTLDAARLASADRLMTARAQLRNASLADQKTLQETISVEKARTQELDKQIRQRDQLAAKTRRDQMAGAPKPGDAGFIGPVMPGAEPAPARGRGGGILPSGGLGTVLARTAAYGAAAAAIYGTIGAIKDGISFSLQFEDSLAKLSGVAGATAGQMEVLRSSIENVASNSRYATVEISEAAMVLAQAGFSVSEIEGSLKAVSNLATASGSTFAESADLATGAVGAFQMQASEMNNVADVTASALNRTKLTVQQLAGAIQYAGATAYANNITFEELTATVATMANAGLRGTTPSTGLRQFLVDLIDPSKKLKETLDALGLTQEDINVKTLGLSEVLDRLSRAGFGSAEAYYALETRSAAAYLALRNNLPALEETRLAMNDLGQATVAAERGADSFTAQWQIFKNNLNQGVSNGIMPAQDALKNFFRTINEWNAVDSSEAMQKLREQLKAGTIDMEIFRSRTEDLMRQHAEGEKLTRSYAGAMDEFQTRVNDANEAVNTQKGVLNNVDEAIRRVHLRQDSLKDGSVALQAEVASLTNRFVGLSAQLDATGRSYYGLIDALRAYRREQLSAMGRNLDIQETSLESQQQGYAYQTNTAAAKVRQWGVDPKVNELINRVLRNRGDDAETARGSLRDIALNLPDGHPMRKQILQLTGGAAGFRNVQAARRSNAANRGFIAAAQSDKGQGWIEAVDRLSQPGTTDAQRQAVIAPLRQYLANPKISPGERQFAAALLEDAERTQTASGLGEKKDDKKDRGGKTKEEREAEKAKREAEKQAREAEKAAREANQRALKIAQAKLKGAGFDLEDALESSRNPLDLQDVEQSAASVDAALQAWITARTEAMEAEVKNNRFSPEEAAAFRREIQREIRAKQMDVARGLAENFTKLMENMTETIEREFAADVAKAEANVGWAQGYRTGMDRYSVRDKIPDFVRARQDRRIEITQEEADRSRMNSLGAKYGGMNEQKNVLGAEIARLKALRDADPAKFLQGDILREREKEFNNLAVAIDAVHQELMVLERSFDTERYMPTSMNEAWAQAIEQYRHANNLSLTMKDTIMQNMTGSLQALHGGFTSFFTDVMAGSKNVLAAFGDFVKGMARYLSELAAKFIASKVFTMVLNLIDPKGALLNTTTKTGVVEVGRRNGGPIGFHEGGIAKFSRGGRTLGGVPNRDTIPALLAKGEYVVRKHAVDQLGPEFMERLNQDGPKALESLRQPIVTGGGGHQETNVYVVKPDAVPQMGKNDILVTVQEDILSDGQTKKLIRHVAQGG